jgi:hypothetical protein
MGVGRSSAPDSRAAGAEATRGALAGSAGRAGSADGAGNAGIAGTGGGDAVLLVVFGAISYDPAALVAGVREVAGGVPVIGCSTHGEIAPDGPRDGTVVVTAFGGSGLSVSTAASENITGRQRDAGAEVAACADAAAAGAGDGQHRVLILLTDGLARDQEEVLRGAYDVLGASVPLFGGAAADGRRMTGTYQIHGSVRSGVHSDDVLHNGVVAAAITSDGPIGIGVRHGWRKAGEAMIVTASTNGRVHHLDDKPALDVYLDRLGAPPEVYHDRAAFSRWTLTRPLGIQRRSGVEARNLSHDVDFEGRSIGGGGGISPGALTWALEGDRDSVLEAVTAACRDAVDALGGVEPLGLLTLSCCGCRAVLGDEGIRVESDRITAEAKGAPFAGFYTQGEIARTRGVNGFHNQTLVVLALG